MDWQERVKETPEKMGKPTRMQFRSYFDAEEMQMLLLEQEDWVIEAFMGDAPSKEVMRIMTQEYFWTQVQKRTMEWILDSDCERTGVEAARKAVRQLTAHAIEMEDFTVADFAKRKHEIKSQDYSWFMGQDLRFQKKMDEELGECAEVELPVYVKNVTVETSQTLQDEKMYLQEFHGLSNDLNTYYTAKPSHWSTSTYRRYSKCSKKWRAYLNVETTTDPDEALKVITMKTGKSGKQNYFGCSCGGCRYFTSAREIKNGKDYWPIEFKNLKLWRNSGNKKGLASPSEDGFKHWTMNINTGRFGESFYLAWK